MIKSSSSLPEYLAPLAIPDAAAFTGLLVVEHELIDPDDILRAAAGSVSKPAIYSEHALDLFKDSEAAWNDPNVQQGVLGQSPQLSPIRLMP